MRSDSTLDCGHSPSPHQEHTTGYGVLSDGKRACYSCCAANLRASMIRDGRADLYISADGREVTDWPGNLRFAARGVRRTRIGFCLDGVIAYFTGPDGAMWSARGPGFTMYARARRLKRAPRRA